MTTSPTAVEPAEEPQEIPALPWAELTAEHFQLLRLAALPTDRSTGARPLRFVQLGRAERHSPEQSLLRLSIDLPGQRVRREQNVLEVWADHRRREVRFEADVGQETQDLGFRATTDVLLKVNPSGPSAGTR